ncbi:MAG: adenylate/guanylate cyclase domain-containing protein [Alphaproteobacteria bacterium]|nr:adenylate/guanylate cyclase domain-containing protein [Alphaproteobacteria bacterium]
MAEAQVVERKLAAIFAADVVGYSHLMQLDEVGTLRALRAARAIIDRLIAEHRGRIFTTAGDSVLADFASAVDAVEAALEIQSAIAEENEQRPEGERLRFRIGVHLGDVIVEGNDLLGDGVNIAARLQTLAGPGGIYVSAAVRDQVGTKLPAAFIDRGPQRLKNMARPLRAFEVVGPGSAPYAGLVARAARATGSRRVRIALAAAAFVVLIGLGVVASWRWSGPPGIGPFASQQVGGPALPATTQTDSAASRSTSAPRLSIVVLPFVNLSNDPEQEYFADGITDDLTTDVSRIAGAVVIARNSAFAYKGQSADPKQIGRDLGARYVLQGSVRRAGSQVRINAVLIDAETDAQLWAERFDRDIGDLFTVQNEITARIARALQSQLAIAESRHTVEHPDALDYILRGRAQLSKPISPENYNEAIGYFESALELDPQSAEAAAWLANLLAVRALDELTPFPNDDLHRAKQLAAHALAAAPNNAMSHYSRAQVLRAEGRCAEAIPEYEAAIALDRSRAPAYAHIGWCKFLTGSVDAVIPYFEQAIRLSPHEPGIAPWYGRLGVVHLLQSHTDEAIVWLEKARSENARLPFVHAWLAAAYGLKGDNERAHAELAEAEQLNEGYGTLATVKKSPWFAKPEIRALADATYFAGLRKAGMPEQ